MLKLGCRIKANLHVGLATRGLYSRCDLQLKWSLTRNIGKGSKLELWLWLFFCCFFFMFLAFPKPQNILGTIIISKTPAGPQCMSHALTKLCSQKCQQFLLCSYYMLLSQIISTTMHSWYYCNNSFVNSRRGLALQCSSCHAKNQQGLCMVHAFCTHVPYSYGTCTKHARSMHST